MPKLVRAPLAGALLLCLLSWPLASAAITVGGEFIVSVNGGGAQSVLGGPDGASNTPLDLAVSEGDVVELLVLIGYGLEIRQYETTITTDDPLSLDYVDGSAVDISTLGFSALADPDATLQDGTPGDGPADSDLCPVGTCSAPSTNTLYRLSWEVQTGFPIDALRDITISIDSIFFDDGAHSLDPAADTMSIRLIPEPGTAGLLIVGLVGLAARSRRSA